MAKLGSINLKGASGNSYTFEIYKRDTNFNAIAAVYIMTKANAALETHNIIYVGQSGDMSERPLNHHRKDCFDRRGANFICLYSESSKDKRLAIETDIRQNYNPPCNQQ